MAICKSPLPVLRSHCWSGLERDSDDIQWRPLIAKKLVTAMLSSDDEHLVCEISASESSRALLF